MCIGISGFIHRTRGVLVSTESNSHTVLWKIFFPGIKDDKPVELRNHVKFELRPTGVLTNLHDWEYHTDEDETPDWYDEDDWREKAIKIGTQILSCWVKDGCKSSLDLRGGEKLTSLGNLENVGGSLDLRDCKNLTSLGNLENVGDSLDLCGCENLTSLGNLESVRETFYSDDTLIPEEQFKQVNS